MRILEWRAPTSYELILFGDSHEGNVLRYAHGYNGCLDYIRAKKNRFGLHMGDEQEAFWIDDKRYDPVILTKTPLRQQEAVIKELKPLARSKSLITILYGNHTDRISPKVGDITEMTCERLGIQYGGFSCTVKFSDKFGTQFKGFFTHGRKMIGSVADDPIRRLSNEKLQLKRHLERKAGDCLVMAKGHCLSDDSEILTRVGWKKYNEISVGDTVLTFNTNNGFSEWQPVEQVFIYENKYETMLQCINKKVDFCVTDEHRIIGRIETKGVWDEYPAQECMELSRVNIPVAGHIEKDFEISDDWINLMGWLIAEGHFRQNGAVQLFQAESRAYKIRNILQRIGFQFSEYRRNFKGRVFTCPHSGRVYQTKEDGITFYIRIDEAKRILQIINEKKIPDFAFEFSDRQFEVLLFAMVAGDGSLQKNSRKNSGYYFTSDPVLADQLQAMCISHGWKAYVSKRKRGDGLAVGFIKQDSTTISSRNINTSYQVWKEVPATKITWCVSVGNGTIFVRRNGKPCILGNTHKLIISEPLPQLYLTAEKEDGVGNIQQHYTKNPPFGKGGYVHPDHRFYLNTGSFLKTFGEDVISYSEKAEYDPIELGYVIIEVNDRQVTGARKVVI